MYKVYSYIRRCLRSVSTLRRENNRISISPLYKVYPSSFSKVESRWRWINARKRRDAFVCWSYMSTPWYRLQAVWAPWWILGSPISPLALLPLKPFFSSSRSISLSPALFLSPFLATLVSLSLSLSLSLFLSLFPVGPRILAAWRHRQGFNVKNERDAREKGLGSSSV